MEQIPQELRNPVMIFKGSQENSLVAITELKDNQNRGVMIAVSLCEKDGFSEVNRISSVYGRNNMTNYLNVQMKQGNLIAVNKEKADRMLHSAGLQSPLENTFISFDNSIAYSTANVKRVSEKSLEIARETESQTRRGAKKPFGQAQLTQSVKTAKEAERQSPPEQTKEQTKKKDDISL